VREVTFRRSPPLATRYLKIVPSRLGARAGVVGAALMVREHVLAPAAVEHAIERVVYNGDGDGRTLRFQARSGRPG
jgi:hypothetical protein